MLRSIRTKILLVTGTIVLVALAVNTYIDTQLFRTQYTSAMESQALTVGRGLTTQLTHLLQLGIPLQELIGFEVQCREVVDAYDDVDYAMVLDQDGTVLFHNRSDFHGQQVTDPKILDALRAGREAIAISRSGTDAYIDALVPLVALDGKPTAFARVGISLATVTSKVDTFVTVAGMVGVGSVGTALVLLLLIVGRLILHPLDQLNDAMQRVGSGSTDLESRVEIESRDELGTIAGAFNHMIEALRKSRGEVERYTQELESKVEERTRELQVMNSLLHDDIQQRKVAEQRYQHLARHDTLTDLPNRSYMMELLTGRMSGAMRHGTTLAVMFLDLDRFKQINDTLGHAAGDALLVEVATRLRRRLRREDTVARLGGDEFVVLLDHPVDADAASKLAASLIEKVTAPMSINGHELVVTTSIGIALFPADGQSAGELLKNADAAMYNAKSLGRNRHQFYTPEMNDRSMERLVLENDLRKAITAGEFELFYQPRFDVTGGCLAGAEALLRWNHPSRGLLAPGAFLNLAEGNGMILALGEWVLRTACRTAAAWCAEYDGPIRVSVNVSTRQVFQGDLLAIVDSALADAGLQPELLEIEIVEDAFIRDEEQSGQIIGELKARGVHVTVDDFGTGYSSLYRLKSLPVNTLKLDRTFVNGLPHDSDDSAIASTVIQLGHSLGLTVVAEGIENDAQAEHLRQLGCDEYQGYLFGRPTDEASFRQRYLDQMTARTTGTGLAGER